MRKIRVFVSSPSDVREERQSARAVIQQLKARFQGRVEIDACFWEAEFYDAKENIQDQLERPSSFDIVVLILWSTLGRQQYFDRLTGAVYESSTRFEIADVLSATADRRPTLLVCRCTRPFLMPADASDAELADLKRRYDATKRFLDRDLASCGVESVNSFRTAADFADTLRDTLVKRIKQIIAGDRTFDRASPSGDDPYKGLRVLGAEDHGLFFGRGRAVHRVVDQLRRHDSGGRPIVIVFGRGGVGKSSFLRAGVLPHIVRGNVIDGVEVWRTALFEPSDSTSDLIGGLAAALRSSDALPELVDACGSVESLAAGLRESPNQTVHLIRSVLDRQVGSGRGAAKLLLVIDPVEEIFTRGSDAIEIAAFAAALRALCESRLVWVLGTLRSDFFAKLIEVRDLQALVDGDGHFNLPPMTVSELTDAVREPAERAGLVFGRSAEGEDLATELVNAAFALQADPLPLLAYALQQLYERSNARVTGELSFEVYERLRRLEGLLDVCADEARRNAERRMQGGQEAAWNEVFGQLVGIDGDNQRVRLYARPEAFANPNAKLLITELEAARLIIRDEDDQHRPVLTIAHEAMLRQWRTLSNWIDHREALLKTSRALSVAAAEWIRNGRRDDDLTLRDARLAAAEHFVAHPEGLPVGQSVAEFVRVQVARRDSERRRRRLVARSFVAALSLALLAAVYSYWRSEQQSKLAVDNFDRATRLADFLFGDVRARLNPELERDNETIRKITAEVTKFFIESAGAPGGREEIAERVERMNGIAEGVAGLARYEEAAQLQEAALELALDRGPSAPRLIAAMHLRLSDWYQSTGVGELQEKAQQHLDAMKKLLRADPTLDEIWNLKERVQSAKGLRYSGQYTAAVHELRSVVDALDRIGASAQAEHSEAVDMLAESLRYAGRFEEGLEVYRTFIEAAKMRRQVLDPEIEVEFAVFLGMTGDPDQVSEAEQRMRRAIAASAGKPRDRAQYQYKLARVLLEDPARLVDAEALVNESYRELLKNPDDKRVAKCLEVRAKIRLQQRRPQEAMEDAQRVLSARDVDYASNKLQREYLDACVLWTDCLRAAGQAAEADRAAAIEEDVRARLTAREREEALRLGQNAPDFER